MNDQCVVMHTKLRPCQFPSLCCFILLLPLPTPLQVFTFSYLQACSSFHLLLFCILRMAKGVFTINLACLVAIVMVFLACTNAMKPYLRVDSQRRFWVVTDIHYDDAYAVSNIFNITNIIINY